MLCRIQALLGIGMPEELSIARAALARSFDVLAMTPKEKVYRCWDTEWPDQSEDVPRVRSVLAALPAELCIGAGSSFPRCAGLYSCTHCAPKQFGSRERDLSCTGREQAECCTPFSQHVCHR